MILINSGLIPFWIRKGMLVRIRIHDNSYIFLKQKDLPNSYQTLSIKESLERIFLVVHVKTERTEMEVLWDERVWLFSMPSWRYQNISIDPIIKEEELV